MEGSGKRHLVARVRDWPGSMCGMLPSGGARRPLTGGRQVPRAMSSRFWGWSGLSSTQVYAAPRSRFWKWPRVGMGFGVFALGRARHCDFQSHARGDALLSFRQHATGSRFHADPKAERYRLGIIGRPVVIIVVDDELMAGPPPGPVCTPGFSTRQGAGKSGVRLFRREPGPSLALFLARSRPPALRALAPRLLRARRPAPARL
jgi:hypothetical protein